MGDIPLTALDLVVIAIVGLSAIVALGRGLVREVFELASWIGALVVAWYAFAPARPIIRDAVGNDILADILTGAAVFIVPLIVFKVLGGVISSAVAGAGLGFIDRILGLAFGLARGALLVCIAYMVGTMLVKPDRHPAWVTNAKVLPYIKQGTAMLRAALPPEVEQRVGGILGGAAGADGKADEKGYPADQRNAVEKILPRN